MQTTQKYDKGTGETINSILRDYENLLKDRLYLMHTVNKGIDADTISLVLKYFNFKKEFLAKMLNMSGKTLDRYTKENRKLTPNDSELIIKLLLLHQKGIEIFGEQDSFNEWLNKPAFGLGNLMPIEIINTSGGIDLIIEELTRIEFGDAA